MNGLTPMLNILRLHSGPQDLPADNGTLIFWVGIALIAGMVIGIPLYGFGQALALNVMDLVVLYAFVVIVLSLRGVPDRWRQTFTAMAGAGAVLGLLMALLMLLAGGPDPAREPEDVATGIVLGMLVLFAWLLLVFGHILQQALGLGMRLVGMLIALGYIVISSVLTQTAIGLFQ
ncbi:MULTISPECIES: hypothetical protein [unclassified Thioalkalivibrio]|uniref:hypothetical protein n=1 Tax=unclassified Thioalkalivibrio TaxID=2621013 RepID=UPI00039D8FF8|nr:MULTISPECIES: hypothetical protein [unclassified Thioalkalivibrio]